MGFITLTSNTARDLGRKHLLIYAIKSYRYNRETLPTHGMMRKQPYLTLTQLVRFTVTSKEGTGDPNEPSYLEA